MKTCNNCGNIVPYKRNMALYKFRKIKYCSLKCQIEKRKHMKSRGHGQSGGSYFICINCSKENVRCRTLQKYCSVSCQMNYEYKNNIRDKKETTRIANETVRKRSIEKFKTNPTKWIGKRGYWIIYIPQQGQKKYHHYIWEQHYGSIPKGYVVHHKDGNKLNNKLENLEMITNEEHCSLHLIQRHKNGELKDMHLTRERDNQGRFK